MQAAVHPHKPLRIIVEVDYGQVGTLVAQLVETVTTSLATRPHPTTSPPAPPPAEETDEPRPPPARVAPPPPARRGNLPPAVADIPAGYTLGPLCQRGHRYQGTRQTLRRLSNGKCAQCERLLAQRRHVSRPHEPAPRPVLVEATATRPELPPHLALNAFLSPIVCEIAAHRYRDTVYTLRYHRDERCVQCTTHHSAMTLAGD